MVKLDFGTLPRTSRFSDSKLRAQVAGRASLQLQVRAGGNVTTEMLQPLRARTLLYNN